METKSLLIIIPARGGSKGIPGKNIKILGDLPLLAWSFYSVLQSKLHNVECILSTDDEQIANVGKNLGMSIPYIRSAALSRDDTSADEVVIDTLDWYEKKRRLRFLKTMWLQPTSPFRPPTVIRQAIDMMDKGNFNAVVGVKPIYRTAQTLFNANKFECLQPLQSNHDSQPMVSRRQEVKPIYTPNGAMYLVNNQSLRTTHQFYPDPCGYIEMDQIQSIDIDDPIDFLMAQSLVSAKLTWNPNISINP